MPPEATGDAARAAFAGLADLPASNALIVALLREVIARQDMIAAALPPVLADLDEVVRREIAPSTATARRWCVEGKLPARKIGKKWMVDLSALKPPTSDQIARLAREAADR